MHLLAAQPGAISDGSEAIDLGQTPGDIVVLSAADTELACLAQAHGALGENTPSLRLANPMALAHHLSVDTYVEAVIAEAKLVVVRLLGGAAYWSYGAEQISAVCRKKGIVLALLPGDDKDDPELRQLSTLAGDSYDQLWAYLIHGGLANAGGFLKFAATLAGFKAAWTAPEPLPRFGLYWLGETPGSLGALRAKWRAGRPVAAVVFYRALVQAANLAAVDQLIAALDEAGLNALPIYTQSLKEPLAAAWVSELLDEAGPAVVLNCTGFALSSPGAERTPTPFDRADCPVLQVVFSGGTEAGWRDGMRGLAPRDIAMNVALPEVDGRIMTRAVSFKEAARFDTRTQTNIVAYRPLPDRALWVARLAAGWARLRAAPAAERKVALVLANYPNRDARIGNGVGLDTPASTAAVLASLAGAGYGVEGAPDNGADLIERLLAGPTNDLASRRWKRFRRDTVARGLPGLLRDAAPGRA